MLTNVQRFSVILKGVHTIWRKSFYSITAICFGGYFLLGHSVYPCRHVSESVRRGRVCQLSLRRW